jgi:hypothetical protein
MLPSLTLCRLGEEKVTSGATKVWNIKRVERLANFVFKYRNIGRQPLSRRHRQFQSLMFV